jgi:hypothetical protein
VVLKVKSSSFLPRRAYDGGSLAESSSVFFIYDVQSEMMIIEHYCWKLRGKRTINQHEVLPSIFALCSSERWTGFGRMPPLAASVWVVQYQL